MLIVISECVRVCERETQRHITRQNADFLDYNMHCVCSRRSFSSMSEYIKHAYIIMCKSFNYIIQHMILLNEMILYAEIARNTLRITLLLNTLF